MLFKNFDGGLRLAKLQRSSEEMQQLIEAISTDRFATYLSACRDDHAKALQLYEWNADLCGAFYAPLQVVEVAFRNTLHRQLSLIYGVNWPVSEIFTKIAPALAVLVTEVQRSLERDRRSCDIPNIVASLHFGFWDRMLSKNYKDSLWSQALHKSFPEYEARHKKKIERKIAATSFREIRLFRNRVFHHEPIFRRHALADDLQRLIDVAAWMYPGLEAWIMQRSAACMLLLNHPPGMTDS